MDRLKTSLWFIVPALLLALLLALPSPQRAQNLWDVVETDALENGLEIIVIPDTRADVVTHMLWYRIGSADEERGKSGLAHYFEHLMFKGTREVAPGTFSKIIAALGGQDNAFTSYDYTAYFQRIASRHLETAMRMEADRMRNLQMNAENIRAERDVVIEERGMRVDGNPGALLNEQIRARLHAGHPYAIPVIGWRAELEQLNLADAEAFYDRHYTPENAILVVAGNTNMAEVKRLAATYYGVIPRGNRLKHARTPLSASTVTGWENPIVYEDARARQRVFSRYYRLPAWSRDAAMDTTMLDMLAEILGGSSTARLHERLVVKDGLAVSATSWLDSLRRDQGEFGIYVVLDPAADFDAVGRAVDAEIQRIIENGVTEAEVARARTQILAEAIYAQDSQQWLAQIFGRLAVIGRDPSDLAIWQQQIAEATPAKVAARAARFLVPTQSVTGHLTPPTPARLRP